MRIKKSYRNKLIDAKDFLKVVTILPIMRKRWGRMTLGKFQPYQRLKK